MKLIKFTQIYALLIVLLCSQTLAADAFFTEGIQVKGSATIGAKASADSKAVLDLRSTTKGLLPPRMTTTQRDAITSPPTGLVIFNTTTTTLNQYTGVAWTAIGGGGAGGAQYNMLPNYNFEDSAAFSTGWTASGGTFATAVGTNILFDTKSATWDSNAAGQTLSYAAQTIPEGYKGQTCEVNGFFKVPSGTATHLLQVYDGTNVIASTPVLNPPSATTVAFTRALFPCPASGTMQWRTLSVASNEPLIVPDNVYLGLSTNLISIQQPTYVGSLRTTGCSGVWSNSTTVFSSFSTITGCTYTASGDVLAPSTMIPGFRIQNAGAGRYLIFARGAFGKNVSTTNADAIFRFNDGATAFSEQIAIGAGSSSGQYNFTGNLNGAISYSTAPGTVSIQLQGKVSTNTSSTSAYVSDSQTSNGTGAIDGLYFDVYFFPTSAQTAIQSTQQRAPNPISIAPGSVANYVPSQGVTFIVVDMVGAGGGGGGDGVSAGNGATGGNTVFGGSTAGGGGGGSGVAGAPGSGGTTTVGSGHIVIRNVPGGSGQGGFPNAATNAGIGGSGGNSCEGGGGGGGGYVQQGFDGAANSGGGGGGAGASASTGTNGGAGGGGGGCLSVQINNPGTISYSVPGRVAGGTAGTGGLKGGDSGHGRLTITEYFGYTTALIANSVSTGDVAGRRIESARVGSICSSSPCTLTDASSGIASVTRNSSGNYNVNFVAGTFSSPPSCVCGTSDSAGNPYTCSFRGGYYTTTTGQMLSYIAGTGYSDGMIDIWCSGKR